MPLHRTSIWRSTVSAHARNLSAAWTTIITPSVQSVAPPLEQKKKCRRKSHTPKGTLRTVAPNATVFYSTPLPTWVHWVKMVCGTILQCFRVKSAGMWSVHGSRLDMGAPTQHRPAKAHLNQTLLIIERRRISYVSKRQTTACASYHRPCSVSFHHSSFARNPPHRGDTQPQRNADALIIVTISAVRQIAPAVTTKRSLVSIVEM